MARQCKISPSTSETQSKATAKKVIQQVMRKFKAGKLKSGRSKKKVIRRKQAIAIGLSEARKKGGAVTPPKNKSNSRKREQK